MKFKLIMAFIDEDKTDAVLDAAREAGATGATVITNAKGQGLKQPFTFFGLSFFSRREIALILVEETRSETLLNAICKAGKLDESLETGIALELTVDKAVGLSQHMELLTKQHPLK